ncbi:MAG: 1-(5-phosphoribosyl)-5-[(5-phosphoribosylamino)methylideneamino]imidazole-4-carboxamide isomerase [Candidatus Bathyarchaeota archaeon]|nr:MAG: 1-(5-phosphoribosyl)-5-[(5-phosphoribosylamino)methylideneamino]imidazole-4-carboxamide isomerase [Candidatus Bathyarchaeota archaeon]
MIVIPAVDIMGGKCVRLFRGDPAKNKVYYEDPLQAAQVLERDGAELIHLVDLDAALGSGDNVSAINRILENINVKAEVGGGIRSLEKAEELLTLGAYRVIFGTVAVNDPSLVKEAISRFGSEHVAVAIDEKDGKVAVHGWKNKSEMDCLELARLFDAMNVGALIFTPISVDGTLEGPRIKKTVELMNSVSVPVVASGGVAKLNDLVDLYKSGVWGVIVGTAIYEKKFTVKEALEALKNC